MDIFITLMSCVSTFTKLTAQIHLQIFPLRHNGAMVNCTMFEYALGEDVHSENAENDTLF